MGARTTASAISAGISSRLAKAVRQSARQSDSLASVVQDAETGDWENGDNVAPDAYRCGPAAISPWATRPLGPPRGTPFTRTTQQGLPVVNPRLGCALPLIFAQEIRSVDNSVVAVGVKTPRTFSRAGRVRPERRARPVRGRWLASSSSASFTLDRALMRARCAKQRDANG